jgi:hypothetical protein
MRLFGIIDGMYGFSHEYMGEHKESDAREDKYFYPVPKTQRHCSENGLQKRNVDYKKLHNNGTYNRDD